MRKLMHFLCCISGVADKNTVVIRHHPPGKRSSKLHNDNLGNGICGILYKWVHFGRGWRPRWFVLHDGVLFYYKIHGHVLNLETHENGFTVIGKKSFRLVNTSKTTQSSQFLPRKPLREIQLKVSKFVMKLGFVDCVLKEKSCFFGMLRSKDIILVLIWI